MSSPESEIELKRKRRLESVEEQDKPSLKLLKLDSAEIDAANYKECTKLFDNPEDVVQGKLTSHSSCFCRGSDVIPHTHTPQ